MWLCSQSVFWTTQVFMDTCVLQQIWMLSHFSTRCVNTPASSSINVLSIQKSPSQTVWSCLWPSTSLTCSSRLTHDRPSQHIPQVTLSLLRKGMWRMNVNGTWLKKKINYKMPPLSAHEFVSLEHSRHPRRTLFFLMQCRTLWIQAFFAH